jgi:hypothetical protein
MKSLGQRWLHLLLERGPHHQSDHQQIQEEDTRLANSVSSVAFVFREKSAHDQGYSHDELHDEVEIRPEGSAGPEKTLHRKENQHRVFAPPNFGSIRPCFLSVICHPWL